MCQNLQRRILLKPPMEHMHTLWTLIQMFYICDICDIMLISTFNHLCKAINTAAGKTTYSIIVMMKALKYFHEVEIIVNITSLNSSTLRTLIMVFSEFQQGFGSPPLPKSIKGSIQVFDSS